MNDYDQVKIKKRIRKQNWNVVERQQDLFLQLYNEVASWSLFLWVHT